MMSGDDIASILREMIARDPRPKIELVFATPDFAISLVAEAEIEISEDTSILTMTERYNTGRKVQKTAIALGHVIAVRWDEATAAPRA